jgi:hypothetical protein
MRTLPRHLLLAAVVLTVCCAERQALATADLQRVAAEMAGERMDQPRSVQQALRQRRARQMTARPAAVALVAASRRVSLPPRVAGAGPETPVVHMMYPPSRFRLPPPAARP